MNQEKFLFEWVPAIRMLCQNRGLPVVTVVEESRNNKSMDEDDQMRDWMHRYGEKTMIMAGMEADGALNLGEIRRQIMEPAKRSIQEGLWIVLKGLGLLVAGPSYIANQAAIALQSHPAKRERRGRFDGKVVAVTGGAQGFGQGIAERFFHEGAHLMLADLNIEKGTKLVTDLVGNANFNTAFFEPCDVTDATSVKRMIMQTVRYYGGLDVLISNAGVLVAGGLEDMTLEDFKFVTEVNYTGFYNCTSAAARVMKSQSEFSEHAFSDIIQINSKSGLQGSHKNFAYAGSKFGSIGLVQSFAMELVSHRIKVNAICPGNYFDGPLWSDPETGLFSQYLNAGKVKGARNIADVRRYYEEKVPMKRGIEISDIMKAIYYVVDQNYETGQALPVTGGQIMLH